MYLQVANHPLTHRARTLRPNPQPMVVAHQRTAAQVPKVEVARPTLKAAILPIRNHQLHPKVLVRAGEFIFEQSSKISTKYGIIGSVLSK